MKIIINEEDLTQNFHKYRKLFVISAYKLTNNPYDAEDLVQEAYIKAITNFRKSGFKNTSFISWINTIIRNLFIDSNRKKKHLNLQYMDDLIIPDIYDETRNAEEKLAAEDYKKIIQTAISRLSTEQQRVVYFRHFENLTFPIISGITNDKMGTEICRMRSALINLRKLTQKVIY